MVLETIDFKTDQRVKWLLQKAQFCLDKPLDVSGLSSESKSAVSEFIHASTKNGHLVIYLAKGTGESVHQGGVVEEVGASVEVIEVDPL